MTPAGGGRPTRAAAEVAAQKNIVADSKGEDDESSGKELFAQELKQRTLQKVAKKPQEKKPDPIKRTHEKKCPICNEPFTDVNAFMSHLGKCNVPEPDPVSSSEGEDSGEVDENGQKIKYSKKDNKKDKSNKSTGKKFKCRICCDVLRYSSFKAHTSGHEKKFKLSEEVQCPQCPSVIAKRDLNPHFLRVHPEADGACCIECLKVMPQPDLKIFL